MLILRPKPILGDEIKDHYLRSYLKLNTVVEIWVSYKLEELGQSFREIGDFIQ